MGEEDDPLRRGRQNCNFRFKIERDAIARAGDVDLTNEHEGGVVVSRRRRESK